MSAYEKWQQEDQKLVLVYIMSYKLAQAAEDLVSRQDQRQLHIFAVNNLS